MLKEYNENVPVNTYIYVYIYIYIYIYIYMSDRFKSVYTGILWYVSSSRVVVGAQARLAG